MNCASPTQRRLKKDEDCRIYETRWSLMETLFVISRLSKEKGKFITVMFNAHDLLRWRCSFDCHQETFCQGNLNDFSNRSLSSPQGGRDGDTHPHPKHRRLLRPVRRGEVRHSLWAGGLLHSGERYPAGQRRHHHRAQIPLQQLWPHHREVCALSPPPTPVNTTLKRPLISIIWLHCIYLY